MEALKHRERYRQEGLARDIALIHELVQAGTEQLLHDVCVLLAGDGVVHDIRLIHAGDAGAGCWKGLGCHIRAEAA